MVTSVMTSSAVAWSEKELVTVAVLPGAIVNGNGSVLEAAARVVTGGIPPARLSQQVLFSPESILLVVLTSPLGDEQALESKTLT